MKKDLLQLAEVTRCIGDYFGKGFEHITTVSVLIGNMAFDAEKRLWADFDEELKLLKMMADYRPDCHVSQWAYSNAETTINGYFQSIEL